MHARRHGLNPTTSHAALVVVIVALSTIAVPRGAVAAELGITLTHLRTSSVELAVVCPADPPTTVLVYVGADQPALIGKTPVSCVGGGVEQSVIVPLDQSLTAGSTVDLSATVSGDSGEISASFPGSTVTEAVSSPATPTNVRVTVGSTSAVLTWRDATTADDPRVEGFRMWRKGHAQTAAASRRRGVFRGLTPGHRYVFHLVAFNDGGDSRPVTVRVRAHSANHTWSAMVPLLRHYVPRLPW